MDLMELVCAVCAALAGGVLTAYGLCVAMFAGFQMHARQAAEKRAVAVGTSGVANAASAVGS